MIMANWYWRNQSSSLLMQGSTVKNAVCYIYTIAYFFCRNHQAVYLANDGNVWSHVALSVSNGTGTIYVNGTNKGTASSLSLPSTSYIATASTQVGNIQYNYTGKIDQVRIFNSALTAGNVKSLYNESTVLESTDGTDSILQFIGGSGDITFS